MAEKVRTELELTPEQDKRLDEITESQRDNMRQAFRSAGSDREAMRSRMQSMRAAMDREIEDILTPEQLEKLRALQDKTSGQRRATVWLLGDDGEPEEQRIVVGLHDDEATEVISGLEEGEEVVVRAVYAES